MCINLCVCAVLNYVYSVPKYCSVTQRMGPKFLKIASPLPKKEKKKRELIFYITCHWQLILELEVPSIKKKKIT